jgi:tricorn protease
MSRLLVSSCVGAVLAIACAAPAAAQIDARMFRYPDVSADRITFVYAGDIWVVPKTGGVAIRLSSPPGEELFPRFSPDGSKIAYSANYDGNLDAYVVPTLGGEPVRLTHHPMDDRVVGWHPDGTRVLFASSRASGRQRFNQFYLVSATGGLPDRLPVPYGEFGAFSPDGQRFAYMPQSQDFRTWKRYRGGWAPDIWIFDTETLAARNVTANEATDGHPMWHGGTMYFMSDRGAEQRQNLWAWTEATGAVRQVTEFKDFDIAFPSIGPDDIVFQAGGRLYLLDLAGEKLHEVNVQVTTDRLTLKARTTNVEKLITSVSLSPGAKRALFEARGDVFSVPAEHGAIVNVTRSSGVAERYPTWSPDGKTLAYWSDRLGEYELTLRPADGSGAETTVTKLGPGFRYAPQWSPDSRKLAFIDQAMRIRIQDLDRKETIEVDQSPAWISHGGLEPFVFAWSPDSRWLAYARQVETLNDALFIYDLRNRRLHQATSGYFTDGHPTFDPEGKYLFYASDRAFDPVYGRYDNSWTYPNATQLVGITLRKDVPSPLAPRNDVEGEDEKKKEREKDSDKKDGDEKDEKSGDGKGDNPDGDKDDNEEPNGVIGSRTQAPKPKSTAPATGKPGTAKEAKLEKPTTAQPKVKPVEIDFDGFEARAVILPPEAGNYSGLRAIKGKLLYRREPRTGASDKKSPVVYYDLKEREEKTVIADASAFEASLDGSKLLVASGKKYGVIETKPDQKLEKTMRTSELEAPVDPRAEWKQMFADAYRFERDYFYDPNMHGVDWTRMRSQYGKLLEDAVTRWDVNFVLGELIAELNASHAYRGGGDEEEPPVRGVGMLGADFELVNGAFRVARIVGGGTWDADVRSPLADPGVNVKEGQYVLAVNGVPLDTAKDIYASFDGLGDKAVLLTVNDKPTAAGARQALVKCLGDETELRFRAWVEQRRRRVDEATGGRVGYIYVQSTGREAQNELVRQFVAQRTKDGLIIDERFNSGGQIPDRFIELLNRPTLSYWAVRDGPSVPWPPVAHRGPKAMLINGWSGSGGDAFPFYFREAELGPIIGSRTWGGLIGFSGSPGLVDGGGVTVPSFRMYDPEGQWFAEGHGVEPDIAVPEDPSQLAKGTDTQLERAIEEVMQRVRQMTPEPKRPPYERRVPSTN